MAGILNDEEMQALRGRMRDGQRGAAPEAVATEILATELRLARLTVRMESSLADFRVSLAKALGGERKVRSEVELDRLTLLSKTQVKELLATGVIALLRCGEQPAVAVVGQALVVDLLERLFGGKGSDANTISLTPLVARVVKRLVDLSTTAWNKDTAKHTKAPLAVEQVLEAPTTRASLAAETPVVHVPVRLALEKNAGNFALLIPLACFSIEQEVREPIKPSLYRALLSSVTVQVRAELGRATIPMAALAEMAVGQVMRLDSSTQELVSILVGEERIWRARPTVRDQHIGVTIERWDVQENS